MKELPDFQVYGFHTGIKLLVTRQNSEQLVAEYQGYGMFSKFNDSAFKFFKDVIDWKIYEPK
jgi:hypothetical protein